MNAFESVEALIDRVIAAHSDTNSPKKLAGYFEAVHQELAPLARALEVENASLRQQLQAAHDEVGQRRKAKK